VTFSWSVIKEKFCKEHDGLHELRKIAGARPATIFSGLKESEV
jgi:hypothetical protein